MLIRKHPSVMVFLALLAVFTAAYGAGSAFIPDSLVESWMQDVEQDHHEKEGA